MAIPFILLSPSLFFFIPLARCESQMFFACTLLHRELRDYSLGQVAFAVFQALLAITQLLCHVSALLTSACNVNKRL